MKPNPTCVPIPSFRRNPLRKSATLVLIIASILTFSVPREIFDPHPGVGYDLYCRLMYGIKAENGASTESLIIVSMPQQAEWFREITIPPEEIDSAGKRPIRAPPEIRAGV